MRAWIVNIQIYDPKDALEIVNEQRARRHNAWIEDESRKPVDEEALKRDHVKLPTMPYDRVKGLLVVLASAAAALIILWAVGVWVDH